MGSTSSENHLYKVKITGQKGIQPLNNVEFISAKSVLDVLKIIKADLDDSILSLEITEFGKLRDK